MQIILHLLYMGYDITRSISFKQRTYQHHRKSTTKSRENNNIMLQAGK